jgi:uncharacterized protein (DUF924 family)
MSTDLPVHLADPRWSQAVLGFWYGELQPSAWFKKDPVVDAAISQRFGGLWDGVRQSGTENLATGAKAALAAVLVLDQFPRNMFRGDPRAFASDSQALTVARTAIALGFDRLLRKDERIFLYLPFEHAEDVGLQARSVELINRLGDGAWSRYALAHKVIIDRFGRFPHRNAVLGRVSTPVETAFLETPGSGF